MELKKSRYPILLILAVALFTVSVSADVTEARRQKMSLNDILSTVKPGQWVKLEGIIQRDRSVICGQIKFLTGNFLDDDWAIDGIVERIDKANQEITLMGVPVKFHKDTQFEPNPTETFKGFNDLKTGMLVELEGTYQKDGKFLTKSIEDESAKLSQKPNLKHEIQVQGRVDSVDQVKARVTLMGIQFKLTDATKGKSAMR